MMQRLFAILAALFFLASPDLPDADEASKVVSCVNANLDELESAKHDFSEAYLDVPFDRNTKLAEGFFFVTGRKLPALYWIVLLDLSSSDQIAYETESGKDTNDYFPPVFVPTEVVQALDACGVLWGGLWQEWYRIIERVPTAPAHLPEWQRLPNNPFSNGGADLLPPSIEVK